MRLRDCSGSFLKKRRLNLLLMGQLMFEILIGMKSLFKWNNPPASKKKTLSRVIIAMITPIHQEWHRLLWLHTGDEGAHEPTVKQTFMQKRFESCGCRSILELDLFAATMHDGSTPFEGESLFPATCFTRRLPSVCSTPQLCAVR